MKHKAVCCGKVVYISGFGYVLRDKGLTAFIGDALGIGGFNGKYVQITITEKEEPVEPIMEMVVEAVGV